jgi:hypothetical protein
MIKTIIIIETKIIINTMTKIKIKIIKITPNKNNNKC